MSKFTSVVREKDCHFDVSPVNYSDSDPGLCIPFTFTCKIFRFRHPEPILLAHMLGFSVNSDFQWK